MKDAHTGGHPAPIPPASDRPAAKKTRPAGLAFAEHVPVIVALISLAFCTLIYLIATGFRHFFG